MQWLACLPTGPVTIPAYPSNVTGIIPENRKKCPLSREFPTLMHDPGKPIKARFYFKTPISL